MKHGSAFREKTWDLQRGVHISAS